MSDVQFATSESIAKFAPAFVKAQSAMGSAVKGKNNPFFKSKYADLAEVIEVCKDALNANGIAFMQPVVDTLAQPEWKFPPEINLVLATVWDDLSKDDKADAVGVLFGSRPRHRIGVCTILLHESGEWMSCTASFPAMKEGPQDYFATTTYLRRACLQAILGIPAEDDDGNKASGKKEAPTITSAMTQDFPPNTPLVGLFKELVPANDTKPAIAMIEVDGVGTMGFDVLKDPAHYSPLLNHFVEFQYGKNGKFRPITSMVLAPTAVQAPLKAVPGPVRTPKAGKGEEASKYGPPPSVDESGEPPTEAYFEVAKDCIGLVIKIEPKSSRDGSKKWHILTFACVNGDYQATVWSQSELGFADINEVLNKQVWFRVWAKEYRGAMQYTVEMLELYNARQAQEDANA